MQLSNIDDISVTADVLKFFILISVKDIHSFTNDAIFFRFLVSVSSEYILLSESQDSNICEISSILLMLNIEKLNSIKDGQR